MQVGLSETSYICTRVALWEMSDAMELDNLRGEELYKALMGIKPFGASEGDWAVRAGLNRGFFTDLKAKNIRPRIDTIRKLKDTARQIEQEIDGPVRQPDQPRTILASADDETVEILQLDLSFSMGQGTTIDDYIEETPVRFDLSYIRTFTRTETTRLRLAKGVGESMMPTLLSSDLVWIDTTQNRLNQQDRIWAISLYGAAAIKRLRKIGNGRVLVISDNPTVDHQEVDEADIVIGGRVIRFARDL